MRFRITNILLLGISAILAACGGNQQTTKEPVTMAAAPALSTQELIDLPGRRFDYTFKRSQTGVVLTEKATAVEHAYTGSPRIRFTGVRLADADIPNTLFFSGAEIDTAVAQKLAPLTDVNVNALMELYVAFFNRIPDAGGLVYWADELKRGVSLQQVADRFYVAASLYPALTGYTKDLADADFVRIVYKNVLGRDTVDDVGLAYWTSQIASGQITRGRLVIDVLNSAHTFKGHPLFGKVADLLDNKIAVARSFAIDQGFSYASDADNIKAGMAVAGAVTDTDIEVAKTKIGFNDTGLYSTLLALTTPASMPLSPRYTSTEFETLINQKGQLGFAWQTAHTLNSTSYVLLLKNFATLERYSYKLVAVASTRSQQQELFNQWGSAGYTVLFQLPFSDGSRFVLMKRETDQTPYRYRLEVPPNGMADTLAQFNLLSKEGFRYESQILLGDEVSMRYVDSSKGASRYTYQFAPLDCCAVALTTMSNLMSRDGYELVSLRTINGEPYVLYRKNTTEPANPSYDFGRDVDDFTQFFEQLREQNSQGKRILMSGGMTRTDSSGVIDSYFNLYIKK